MEPFSFTAQTTADSNGYGTITFQTAPTGQTFTGTVSIPGASPGVVGTVLAGGTVWGTISGAAPFGPVSSPGGVALQVTFRGAVAGQTVAAVWHGRAGEGLSGMPLPLPASTVNPWDYGQEVVLNVGADFAPGVAFTPPFSYYYDWSDIVIGAKDVGSSNTGWLIPAGSRVRVNSLNGSLASITAPSVYPITGWFGLQLIWTPATGTGSSVIQILAPWCVQSSAGDETTARVGQLGVDVPVNAAPGQLAIWADLGVNAPAASMTWSGRFQMTAVCSLYTAATVG